MQTEVPIRVAPVGERFLSATNVASIALAALLISAPVVIEVPQVAIPAIVIGGALLAFLEVRAWRTALIVDKDAVRIRNLFRSRTLAWSEVESIDLWRARRGMGYWRATALALRFRSEGHKTITARATAVMSSQDLVAIRHIANRQSVRWEVPEDIEFFGLQVGAFD